MVNYRQAKEEDYIKINDFHNKIYKSKRTIEEFYWEFHNGPFGPSIYVIAEDQNRIVGTNCVIPIDLISTEDEIIKSGKSEDTLVDPEYRGQKIFYKIYDFLFEKCIENNIKVIWGFTAARKPFKNLGFSIPFDHSKNILVKDIQASYNYLKKLNSNNNVIDKIKIFAACSLSRIKSNLKINTQSLKKFKFIEDHSNNKNDVNTLIRNNLKIVEKSFALFQTDTYQKWRIYQNPNLEQVSTYSYFEKDVLKGLIIFNSSQEGISYISQANFHTDLNDNDSVAMIKHATSIFIKKKQIHLIRNWQFGHNKMNLRDKKLMTKASFLDINKGIGFVWKDLADTKLDPNLFYLSRMATQGLK